MQLSININGFVITSIPDLKNDLQRLQAHIYIQSALSKATEFIAQLTTILIQNGVIYETTEFKNSEVILTFKKACDSSELVDIFNKLEEAFS